MKIITQKGNYGPGAGHQFGRVNPLVEVIFHILHLPMQALMQPRFKAACMIIEFFGARNAAIAKAEAMGLLPDVLCELR